MALEGTRTALAAVAELKSVLERLDRLIASGADPMPLSLLVEEMRVARRHADETLRDAQEAADRALDAMGDVSGTRSVAYIRGR